MKTVQLRLSDSDIRKYGIDPKKINFETLIDKVRGLIAQEAIEKCQKSAKKHGLDQMTIEEIDAEIRAVRNAKNNT